jgi:hypothetical protein
VSTRQVAMAVVVVARLTAELRVFHVLSTRHTRCVHAVLSAKS